MKITAISLAVSTMIFSLGLSAFAPAQPSTQPRPGPVVTDGPVIVEGKDRPILLGRMVVTATPLD